MVNGHGRSGLILILILKTAASWLLIPATPAQQKSSQRQNTYLFNVSRQKKIQKVYEFMMNIMNKISASIKGFYVPKRVFLFRFCVALEREIRKWIILAWTPVVDCHSPRENNAPPAQLIIHKMAAFWKDKKVEIRFRPVILRIMRYP